MYLYGVFERLPLAGIIGSSSIVFSAAYTIYMFNRITFGGSYSKRDWISYMPDLNRREFHVLLPLITMTILLGIYPNVILDNLHVSVTGLLY